jgi:hypothetical protein
MPEDQEEDVPMETGEENEAARSAAIRVAGEANRPDTSAGSSGGWLQRVAGEIVNVIQAIPDNPVNMGNMGAAVAYKYHEDVENKYEPILGKKAAYEEQKRIMLADEEEEMRQEWDVVRVLGLVFRQIAMNSPEALTEGVVNAIKSEYNEVLEEECFNPRDVHEWDDVCAKDPTSRLTESHLIVGQKGMELSAPNRRYKARLVAGGHRVKGSRGGRIAEMLNHVIPASLTATRIAELHAAGFKDGVVYHGDVKHAYIKSFLGGAPMWIVLPPRMRPKSHARFRKPCVRLYKALYGLRRSGLDWGTKVRNEMISALPGMGYKLCRDCGETSVFYKGDIVVVIFTDDFKIAGPAPQVRAAFEALHKQFGFSDSSYKKPEEPGFVGVERTRLPSREGFTRIKLQQTKYAILAVEKFEKRLNRSMKGISTPMKSKREKQDYDKAEVQGDFYEDAPEHIGVLYWLARGTRPDIIKAVQSIAQHLHSWTVEDDEALIRIFRYVKSTSGMGVVYNVCHREFASKSLYLDLWVDADHAGSTEDARSTSGWATLVRGHSTMALVDWSAKKQTSTAKSTPDAEITALADGCTRSSAILWVMLGQLWGRELMERMHSDNSAAVSSVKSGTSKKLAYLRRTQRVSLGVLADYVGAEGCSLLQEPTKEQHADLFTKGLEHGDHYAHCRALGIE